MFQKKYFRSKKYSILIPSLCALGMLTACTQSHEPIEETKFKETEITINAGGSGSSQNTTAPDEKSTMADTAAAETSAVSHNDTSPASNTADMAARFGEHCISEQTFEVELSEYSGKVYFVPFSPSNSEDFHMQIIQDDNILTYIPAYVPANLSGESFTSLDAVSFYDINFDGNTDILLIETYGSTTFAAVYYGYNAYGADDEKYFVVQEELSDNLTRQASPLSVSQIRTLLSAGKRNGEFSDYKEAYQAVAGLWNLDRDGDIQFSLIYVDDDDIPELSAGLNGYYTSLYTYDNGRVYTLMEQWPYGVMGNAGYEYSPRKNSIRNDNADYAGAILHTTYMTVTDRHTLDIVAQITFYNFDDSNGNGMPDEDEMGSMGMYGVSYLNGVEATDEQCAAYDVGGYEFITGTMTFDSLLSALNR